MSQDDLVREVRAARDEYCRPFGYDVEAIVRDLREQERAGGRKVVRLSPRRPARTGREVTARPNGRAVGRVSRAFEVDHQPAGAGGESR